MKTSLVEMIEGWAKVLPDFSRECQALAADHRDAEDVFPCAALARLAELVVVWWDQGKPSDIELALRLAEQHLSDAEARRDDEARDLLAAGFLETLQGLAGARAELYAALEDQMGERCLYHWREVEHFWDGDAIFAHPITQLWLQAARIVRRMRAKVLAARMLRIVHRGGEQ
ncbi:MAG: hypothetical protein ABIP12_04415 [Terriglobales bacterium]